jgi:mono/diheme cytochrome c family protein
MTKSLLMLMLAVVLTMVACGGSDSGSGSGDSDDDALVAVGDPDLDNGEKIFNIVCVACHGPSGEGIKGLGKPMPGSEFINSLSDDELVEFVKTGRPTDDPLNTTGVQMPARGGQDLSDQDVVDVVSFVRTLA